MGEIRHVTEFENPPGPLPHCKLPARAVNKLTVSEVKEKGGAGFGHPLEMIDAEKQRRVRAAIRSWLATHPEVAKLDLVIEAAAVQGRRVERVPFA
jgi:Holliday junction resolvase-like predicted endonuclease